MVFFKNNLISAIIQLFLGVVLIFFIQNIQIAFVFVLIEFFFLIIRYFTKGFYNNTVYIFFLICLFTFLIGGFFINIGSKDYFILFPTEAYFHISYCLFLCMFFSSLTYDYNYSRKNKEQEVYSATKDDSKLRRIRKSALWIFYVFSLFSIVVNAEKARFVQNSSYLSYYTDYVSRLPSVFPNLERKGSFVLVYIYMANVTKVKADSKKRKLDK